MGVEDLAQSIRFYSTLFAAEPTVTKPDYAKWMLDDPRVNFAISTRGGNTGIDHLWIQAETAEELREVYGRLQAADRPVLEEGAATCCYAKSEKAWINDPQGLAWETFLTHGESTVYGDHGPTIAANPGETPKLAAMSSACCVPAVAPAPVAAESCCSPAIAAE
jgi:hypothetical protein